MSSRKRSRKALQPCHAHTVSVLQSVLSLLNSSDRHVGNVFMRDAASRLTEYLTGCRRGLAKPIRETGQEG